MDSSTLPDIHAPLDNGVDAKKWQLDFSVHLPVGKASTIENLKSSFQVKEISESSKGGGEEDSAQKHDKSA